MLRIFYETLQFLALCTNSIIFIFIDVVLLSIFTKLPGLFIIIAVTRADTISVKYSSKQSDKFVDATG